MGWWQERSGRGMCSGGDPFLLKASLRLLHLGGVVKDKPDFLRALWHELAHAGFQRSCSTHVKFQPYLHFETKYRTGTCSNSRTDWDKALQPPAFRRQRQRVVARFSQAAQARHCRPLARRCNLQPTEAPSAQRAPSLVDVVSREHPPNRDVPTHLPNCRQGLTSVLVKLLQLSLLWEVGHLLMEELWAVTFN